jgi:hypothetical protein
LRKWRKKQDVLHQERPKMGEYWDLERVGYSGCANITKVRLGYYAMSAGIHDLSRRSVGFICTLTVGGQLSIGRGTNSTKKLATSRSGRHLVPSAIIFVGDFSF